MCTTPSLNDELTSWTDKAIIIWSISLTVIKFKALHHITQQTLLPNFGLTCLANLRVAKALQVERIMYCCVIWSSMGCRVCRGSKASKTQRWWSAEQNKSHRQLTDFTTSATTDAHKPLCKYSDSLLNSTQKKQFLILKQENILYEPTFPYKMHHCFSCNEL